MEDLKEKSKSELISDLTRLQEELRAVKEDLQVHKRHLERFRSGSLFLLFKEKEKG